MIQNFFQKVLGIREKEEKSQERIVMDLNYKFIRIAAALVVGISIYWLIIDRASSSYNLSVYSKVGVILQLLSSIFMFFVPRLVDNISDLKIRIFYIAYYLIIIAGVVVLTLSRNIAIVEAGEVSSNIGVSVSAFYLFLVAFMPLPKFIDSAIIVVCMIVGLALPEILVPTSTYSLFGHVILAVGFSFTYHFYRKTILKSAERKIENSHLNNVLLQNSYVDELTGILNRRSMEQYIDYLLDNSVKKHIGVAFFDADSFKRFNDHYGHNTGDEALKILAKAVNEKLGDMSNGYFFRYGGEEFAVVLDSVSEQDLIEVMIKIRNAVYDANISRSDLEHFDRLTVTVGGSIEPLPNDTGDYVAKADNQLVIGKSSYQNCIYINGRCIDAETQAGYDAKLVEKTFNNQLYLEQFEEALQNREFVVYYQPKYDGKTKNLIAAEALIRWQKKDGSMIPPGLFIPILEATDRISKLDEYVLQAVASLLKERTLSGKKMIPISINMSRSTLFQKGEIERFHQIMEQIGLAKEWIPIEITESAAVDTEKVEEYAKKMKEFGFSLHLDDYGNGYSSLVSLSRLPLDAVKLDKSIVDDIGNVKGNEIIRHTIELAHFLKMTVVAEGAENVEQVQFLNDLDCDAIQGYYFCKPLPEADFEKLLE